MLGLRKNHALPNENTRVYAKKFKLEKRLLKLREPAQTVDRTTRVHSVPVVTTCFAQNGGRRHSQQFPASIYGQYNCLTEAPFIS